MLYQLWAAALLSLPVPAPGSPPPELVSAVQELAALMELRKPGWQCPSSGEMYSYDEDGQVYTSRSRFESEIRWLKREHEDLRGFEFWECSRLPDPEWVWKLYEATQQRKQEAVHHQAARLHLYNEFARVVTECDFTLEVLRVVAYANDTTLEPSYRRYRLKELRELVGTESYWAMDFIPLAF